jgi:hypothetical protein
MRLIFKEILFYFILLGVILASSGSIPDIEDKESKTAIELAAENKLQILLDCFTKKANHHPILIPSQNLEENTKEGIKASQFTKNNSANSNNRYISQVNF